MPLAEWTWDRLSAMTRHVFYDNLSELKNYPLWWTLFGHVGRKQLLQESPDAYGSEDGIFYEFDPR